MAKNAAQIVTDMTPPSAPTFALNADSGNSNSDGITNDATVNVSLTLGTSSWDTVDGGCWSTGSGTSFELADDTTYAVNAVQVRVIDVAGNTSAAAKNAAQIYDDVAAPTFALNADSGSSNSDNRTNDATVNVTLATDAASWEYSVDGGSMVHWQWDEL